MRRPCWQRGDAEPQQVSALLPARVLQPPAAQHAGSSGLCCCVPQRPGKREHWTQRIHQHRATADCILLLQTLPQKAGCGAQERAPQRVCERAGRQHSAAQPSGGCSACCSCNHASAGLQRHEVLLRCQRLPAAERGLTGLASTGVAPSDIRWLSRRAGPHSSALWRLGRTRWGPRGSLPRATRCCAWVPAPHREPRCAVRRLLRACAWVLATTALHANTIASAAVPWLIQVIGRASMGRLSSRGLVAPSAARAAARRLFRHSSR